MQNDIEIFRTGEQLVTYKSDVPDVKGNREVNWLGIGLLAVGTLGICYCAYQWGKITIEPQIKTITKENEKLKKELDKCPIRNASIKRKPNC